MRSYKVYFSMFCVCYFHQSIEGSTCLFSALLKRCLHHDVVAICRYTPRKNTPPRFVALIPQVAIAMATTSIQSRLV